MIDITSTLYHQDTLEILSEVKSNTKGPFRRSVILIVTHIRRIRLPLRQSDLQRHPITTERLGDHGILY